MVTGEGDLGDFQDDDVQLRTPPACPVWCTERAGHGYDSAVSCGSGGDRWWARWHCTATLAQVDASPHGIIRVGIVAQELVNAAGDVITEPARVDIELPEEWIVLGADGALALAAALQEAAANLVGK